MTTMDRREGLLDLINEPKKRPLKKKPPEEIWPKKKKGAMFAGLRRLNVFSRSKRSDRLIVYKTLRSATGASQFQGFVWPLPSEDGTPGAWVEIDKKEKPKLCYCGLHGWLTEQIARNQGSGYSIYEMEIEGEIDRGTDKACGRRGRLLMQITDDSHEAVVRLGDLVWQ